MSGRAWIFIGGIAAISLLVLLAVAVRNPPSEIRLPDPERLAQVAGHRPGAARCHPDRLGWLAGARAAHELAACREAAEEYRLRRAGLTQQIRASDAAEAMVTLGYYQFLAMLAGFVVGLVTLVAAGFAAWYAKRAAEAAETALRHSERVSYAELRAYLFIGSTKVLRDPAGQHEIEITLQNSGQTPARRVTIWVRWDLAPYPFGISFPEDFTEFPMTYQAIGPGMTRTIGQETALSPGQVAEIRAGRLALIFSVRFEYETYSDERIVEPCVHLHATGPKFAEEALVLTSVFHYAAASP